MKSYFNPGTIDLIIGLGNQGEKYENTYHNAGFLFIDSLAKNLASGNFEKSSSKKFMFLKTGRVILVKTLVFMNESGEAVRDALTYFRTTTEKILVAHDDADLKLGEFKLTTGQSHAGHKGIASIITALKTKDFQRIRIGIRHDANIKKSEIILPAANRARTSLSAESNLRRAKAGEFVLRSITAANKKTLNAVFKEIILKNFPSS